MYYRANKFDLMENINIYFYFNLSAPRDIAETDVCVQRLFIYLFIEPNVTMEISEINASQMLQSRQAYLLVLSVIIYQRIINYL